MATSVDTWVRAQKLSDAQLRALAPKKRAALEAELARWIRRDAQANQLVYYRPVNADAMALHRSVALEFGIQGGNKSGKTALMLAEAVIQMTGVVPIALSVCATCRQPMAKGREGGWDHAPADGHAGVLRYPVEKLRPPIRVRLVVTSNVNAWDENLKPKLQYSQWNGRLNEHGLPGDPRCGHWGLIPQRFLLNGSWGDSWSERHRKLTLNLHGDGGTEPGSTLVVMSHIQALEDFNQGSYHLVVEDEIPPEEIHRANKFRTLEVGGRILTGGTPPDERAGAVAAAWFYDQILAPGLEGANPDTVGAVALWTEHNRTLDASAVAALAEGLSPDERRARMRGESLHLAGVIVRGFTEKPRLWCFACHAAVALGLEACPVCGGGGPWGVGVAGPAGVADAVLHGPAPGEADGVPLDSRGPQRRRLGRGRAGDRGGRGDRPGDVRDVRAGARAAPAPAHRRPEDHESDEPVRAGVPGAAVQHPARVRGRGVLLRGREHQLRGRHRAAGAGAEGEPADAGAGPADLARLPEDDPPGGALHLGQGPARARAQRLPGVPPVLGDQRRVVARLGDAPGGAASGDRGAAGGAQSGDGVVDGDENLL